MMQTGTQDSKRKKCLDGKPKPKQTPRKVTTRRTGNQEHIALYDTPVPYSTKKRRRTVEKSLHERRVKRRKDVQLYDGKK
jgi:hypothetical protein